MAGTTKEISMVKQLLRLHQQGTGIKAISRMLGISKNTVKKYLHQVQEQRLDITTLLAKNDEEVERILSGKDVQHKDKLSELQALFPDMSEELKKTGFTLHYLWCKYRQTHPQGYGYSQFCYYYGKYMESKNAVMHFDRDFGEKLSYVEYETGKIIEREFFVAVLGYSQYTDGETSESQQKDDFIESVQNALYYFQGVPQVLVPDNLKSAVTKSSKYDPCLNENFLDMANHYDFAVMPARSRKPRDKSLVKIHILDF